jgi:hypothetical protein
VDGVLVRTPRHPQGRKIFVTLSCISADSPSGVSVTGGSHYMVTQAFCLRCTASFVTLNDPHSEFKLSLRLPMRTVDVKRRFPLRQNGTLAISRPTMTMYIIRSLPPTWPRIKRDGTIMRASARRSCRIRACRYSRYGLRKSAGSEIESCRSPDTSRLWTSFPTSTNFLSPCATQCTCSFSVSPSLSTQRSLS